jgi:hypothetical protein
LIEMSALSMSDRLSELSRDGLLRVVLKVDAAVTGVNGVAYLAAAEPLEDLLGVQAGLLRGLGAFLVVFAVLVAVVASRAKVPQGMVTAIAGANAVWAAGSVAFAIAGVSSPTTVGTIWIAMQAIVVAAFAALQWRFSR